MVTGFILAQLPEWHSDYVEQGSLSSKRVPGFLHGSSQEGAVKKTWVPSPLWYQLEITAVKHSSWYMIVRKYPFLLLKQLWGGSRVIEIVMYPWKPGLVWQQHGMTPFLRQTQWSEPDLVREDSFIFSSPFSFTATTTHTAISLRTTTQIISRVYQGYLLLQKAQGKCEEGRYDTLWYMTLENLMLPEKSFILSFINSLVTFVP